MAFDPRAHELVVVDFQDRLYAAMPEESRERARRANETLVWLCRELAISVLFTEQYPQGLGNTAEGLGAVEPFVKTAFAATDEPGFYGRLAGKGTIVLTGMEAHVCVAHTAAGLRASGREVIVVSDACVSRREADRADGLAWMRQRGCAILPCESVCFGLLARAGGPIFKELSRRVR